MNNSFIDRVNAIVQQNQTAEPVYPDTGIGALENVANNVPRQTMIADQPHMLAYINPQEEKALRDMGGAGLPGPDGIPSYFFFGGSTGFGSFGDRVAETASNVGSSIRDTASNVYDTVSTGLTNTFGDQGSVEKFFDENVYDFDQDSTPDTTVYGTGPVEPVETTILPDPVTTVTAPLSYETTQSTKTFQELYDEALAAGKKMFFHGGAYHTVTPVEEETPVEEKTSVETTGALPSTSNSLRETIANIITPFDSAFYKDGTLYGYDEQGNTIELTGGGDTYNTTTGMKNYVYGVSDDPTTGTKIDTTGMSEEDANVAIAKQTMLYDIPPDDLSYFGSFFANNIIPVFGGMLATKMLDQGIEGRRAVMDAEIEALEGGATPLYDQDGKYIGHTTPSELQEESFSYDPDVINPKTEGSYTTALQDLQGSVDLEENIENDEQIIEDDPVVKSIYNKYYKSGKGTYLPAWLRRFSSGVSIDELLTKIEVDGEIKYQTPEGEIIDAKYITGAIVGPDTTETE